MNKPMFETIFSPSFWSSLPNAWPGLAAEPGAKHTATPRRLVVENNTAILPFRVYDKDAQANVAYFYSEADAYEFTEARTAHYDLAKALRDLLATTLEQMPPFEAGIEAQNAWADRCAAARNNAAYLLTKAGAQ